MAFKSSDSGSRVPFLLKLILLPFALVLGIFVAGVMMLLLPMAAFKGWRHQQRINHKLIAENRIFDLRDLNNQFASDNRSLVVEIAHKGPSTLWMVALGHHYSDQLSILPTYASWKADPRGVFHSWQAIEHLANEQLPPFMRRAIQIRCTPKEFLSLPSDAIESAKVVFISADYSPSSLLDESLDASN